MLAEASPFAQSIIELGIELDLFNNEQDFELRQLGREMQGMLRQTQFPLLALFLALDQVGGRPGRLRSDSAAGFSHPGGSDRSAPALGRPDQRAALRGYGLPHLPD